MIEHGPILQPPCKFENESEDNMVEGIMSSSKEAASEIKEM